MTDDDVSRRPEIRELKHSDIAAAARELDRLRAEYPHFTFSRDGFGWHGACWVAQRIDRMGCGVHTVITADIGELRAALDLDSHLPEPDRLTREQAFRALL